jgi:hypothetical protein
MNSHHRASDLRQPANKRVSGGMFDVSRLFAGHMQWSWLPQQGARM